MRKSVFKKNQLRLLNTCLGCLNCCRETIVPISNQDVARLSEFTGRPAKDLVVFYDDEEVDYRDDDPVWATLDQGPRMMGLKKKNDQCEHLGDDGLCTVYLGRPNTCRSFPFDVEIIESKKVRITGVNDAVLCDYVRSDYKYIPELKKDVLNEEKADEAYHALIEQWNKEKAGGTADEFLTFLGLQ